MTLHERQREQHLRLLEQSDRALRGLMHEHFLDDTAREHIERAIHHVREARLTLTDPQRARTVERLSHDLSLGEELLRQAAQLSVRSSPS